MKGTSEIKGVKALVFVAAMILVPFVLVRGAEPEQVGAITGASFGTSTVAWVVSKMLPDGWLDVRRTAALAMVLSAAICFWEVR
jgi:hypothetical protein